MPNGTLPTWDDWINNLTEQQRQYEIWRVLYELQNRKKVDRVIQFFGAFSGAVITLGVLASVTRFFI